MSSETTRRGVDHVPVGESCRIVVEPAGQSGDLAGVDGIGVDLARQCRHLARVAVVLADVGRVDSTLGGQRNDLGRRGHMSLSAKVTLGNAQRRCVAEVIYLLLRQVAGVVGRQQSLALRCREWEDRAEPLLPWSTMIVRGAGVMIFTSAVLAILI